MERWYEEVDAAAAREKEDEAHAWHFLLVP